MSTIGIYSGLRRYYTLLSPSRNQLTAINSTKVDQKELNQNEILRDFWDQKLD